MSNEKPELHERTNGTSSRDVLTHLQHSRSEHDETEEANEVYHFNDGETRIFENLKLRKIIYQNVQVNCTDQPMHLDNHHLKNLPPGDATLVGESKENIGEMQDYAKKDAFPYVLELFSLNQPLQEKEHLLSIFYNLSKLPKGSKVRLLIGDVIQEFNIAIEKLSSPTNSPHNSQPNSPTMSSKSPTNSNSILKEKLGVTQKISPREMSKEQFIEFARTFRDDAISDGRNFVTNTYFQFGLKLLRDSKIEYYVDYLSNWIPEELEQQYEDEIEHLLKSDPEFISRFESTQIDYESKMLSEARQTHRRVDKRLLDMGSELFKKYELIYLLKLFTHAAENFNHVNSTGINLNLKPKDNLAFTCYTYAFSKANAHPDAYLWQTLWHKAGYSEMKYLRTKHTSQQFTIADQCNPKLNNNPGGKEKKHKPNPAQVKLEGDDSDSTRAAIVIAPQSSNSHEITSKVDISNTITVPQGFSHPFFIESSNLSEEDRNKLYLAIINTRFALLDETQRMHSNRAEASKDRAKANETVIHKLSLELKLLLDKAGSESGSRSKREVDRSQEANQHNAFQ